MNELGKEAKQRGGVTNKDADTLLEWGKEVDPNNEKGLQGRDDRGETHWKGGEHIHLGGKHIPIKEE